jgi:broad specificity phosphatase PhoE
MIDIFIFRHGETDWNKKRRLQGQTDIPLNETGREQARDLAIKLKRYNPEVILTSDLSRAKETAEIVNKIISTSVIKSAELRECSLGDSEGLVQSEVVEVYGEAAWRKWLSVHPSDHDFSFPNGETKRAHLNRMAAYLNNFLKAERFKRIAISTHGASLRRLIHNCSGAPEEPVPLPNGALYRISFDPKPGKWVYQGRLE